MALQARKNSGAFEIWAPRRMKETSRHKTTHSVQREEPTCRGDGGHHVRRSSEGIVRMVATGGKDYI